MEGDSKLPHSKEASGFVLALPLTFYFYFLTLDAGRSTLDA